MAISANYNNIELRVANMINEEITRVANQFGRLDQLVKIKPFEKPIENEFALYRSFTKEILIKPLQYNFFQQKAKYHFSQNFWSTDSPAHSIRHELGHAVARSIEIEDPEKFADKLDKVEEIIKKIHEEKNYEIFSQYGCVNKDNELVPEQAIAEAFAEVMNGNPRKTAQTIFDIIFKKEN